MVYYELGFHPLADAVAKAVKELDAQNYGTAKNLLLSALAHTQEFYLTGKEHSRLVKQAEQSENTER